MRDYNTIPFRSPNSKLKKPNPPLVSPFGSGQSQANAHGAVREDSHASTSTTVATTSNGTHETSSPRASSMQIRRPQSSPRVSLSAGDAMALRRDGPDAVIARLRASLEESEARDGQTKTALAKSDAVILELRSSVRTLKRQLERSQEERMVQQQEHEATIQQRNASDSESQQRSLIDDAKDSRVGELQVELDRAHAQILTADMVRKELEDTLEAEQYTWELRVEDQERMMQEIQHECTTLTEDLEATRSQWEEAEESWSKQVEELKAQVDKAQQELARWKTSNQKNNNGPQHGGRDLDLQEKIQTLEQERVELQGCLDEALKELEAVDAELQGDVNAKLIQDNHRLQEMLKSRDGNLLEPLQHLHRFLLERDGVEGNFHNRPTTEKELLAAIQSHLDRGSLSNKDINATRKRVSELESHVSVYKGDLQAREERNVELRTSLKEAVGLLKPLQDAAAKADREKQQLLFQIDQLKKNGIDKDEMKRMRRQMDEKDDEIEDLKQEIQSLQIQLSKSKLAGATVLVSANRSPSTPAGGESLSKARQDLQAKRASEEKLKNLLRDARTKFSALHEQNNETETTNTELQGRLRSAENHLSPGPSATARDVGEGVKNAQRALESEMIVLKGELAKKEVELRGIQGDLELAKAQTQALSAEDKHRLDEAQKRVDELNDKLGESQEELKSKRQAERALNKSLNEALNLLRPLQLHLEEAESEKRALEKEIDDLRRKMDEEMSTLSRSTPNDVNVKKLHELQSAVQQLEKENSQLHDALEDMSQSLNVSHLSGNTGFSQKNESRLREEIVELKSRYEVTQTRLQDAFIENHSLVEALQKRDEEERCMIDEIDVLTEKLKLSEAELRNSKAITSSAQTKNQNGYGRRDEETQSLNVSHLSGNTGFSQKNESRLREEIVELKSRYEVTQTRLQNAFVENHSLVEALQKRDEEERYMIDKIDVLTENLKLSEAELRNAEAIASSAQTKSQNGYGRRGEETLHRVNDTDVSKETSQTWTQRARPSF
jgi:chromosome segregation ATPase